MIYFLANQILQTISGISSAIYKLIETYLIKLPKSSKFSCSHLDRYFLNRHFSFFGEILIDREFQWRRNNFEMKFLKSKSGRCRSSGSIFFSSSPSTCLTSVTRLLVENFAKVLKKVLIFFSFQVFGPLI